MPNDPFDVLGVPARFDIQPKAVEQAYLNRVAHDHPDLVAGDAEAISRAAVLNASRLILLDPEKRARSLLDRFGYKAKNDSLPDGFLFEIMDVRSQLEQAALSQNAEDIEKLERWASAERKGYIDKVSSLFASLELAADGQGVDIASKLRTTLNAWRYIERMLEQTGSTRA
jgi:curved DNA-binding protein CbpA